MTDQEDVTLRERLRSLIRVAKYRPVFSVGIITLGFLGAILEGIGIGFIVPIVEFAQSSDAAANADGAVGLFVSVYDVLGIPFTLEFLILGVTLVMTTRYTVKFLISYARAWLKIHYEKFLKRTAFERALSAGIPYFDKEGSDDILNAIITQTKYAGRTIQRFVQIVEQFLLVMLYLGITLIIAPWITIGGVVLLGFLAAVMRVGVGSGQEVGNEVADANERIQSAVQAGTQGVRDIRLFGMSTELFDRFAESLDQYAESTLAGLRNQAAITNFYQLLSALGVFGGIYILLTFTQMSFANFGVYLFGVFRLATQGSHLGNLIYRLEMNVPHLVRTQDFVDELDTYSEPDPGTGGAPETVEKLSFEGVTFGYGTETVLSDVTFSVEEDQFIAFVGESGAGKSTIASLIARFYRPNEGHIRANDREIDEFTLRPWRDRIAMVRQSPYIFDTTLWENITVGNRNATKTEVERVCEIAQVTEFLDDLPNGFETELGDDGVRLSGGQRQRVALSRALLKDAEILILDEATSDLDTRIERKVKTGIEEMDRDYIVIAIAHRLSTVQNADRIYTLENGEIVESGSHNDLLDKDGEYASLYTKQVR